MFLFFVLYHLMLSGNFYGSEIRHGISLVLIFVSGIFLGFVGSPGDVLRFNFFAHLIILVTRNPEYPLEPKTYCSGPGCSNVG